MKRAQAMLEGWKKTFIKKLFPYRGSKIDFETPFIVKNENMPIFLYKYRTFSTQHLAAFRSGLLYMSPAESFNDPYDSAVYFDSMRFYVENIDAHDFITKIEQIKIDQGSNKPFAPTELIDPVRAGDW